MKIVDDIKIKLGEKLLSREIKKSKISERKFSGFFRNAVDTLILLPEEDLYFRSAFDVVRFVKIHKKNVTLILPDHKRNLLPNNFEYQFITVSPVSLSNLGLAAPSLIEDLKKKSYDIFIDLTLNESSFYSSIALNTMAEIKIALFEKENSEKIFNLLFDADKTNYENSCRNLLNSLQMF